MGSRQKYIKDSGYEMEDDFTDALHKMPPLLAFKIGKYIENNLINPPINSLVAYVIAGVVKYEGEPYYFVVEIIKDGNFLPVLSNLLTISSDEYLDFINLNQYIKPNGRDTKIKRNNREALLNTRHTKSNT
jgi:hypothetical protein|tara:strand:- start:411 stop:803 length:393 start_codon:yes stop_codon:yes gene_type:complete